MIISEAIKKTAKYKTSFSNADIIKALKGQYSRQAVATVLKNLVEKQELIREGSGRYTFYALPQKAACLIKSYKKILRNKKLEEHAVLSKMKDTSHILDKDKENIDTIFFYAFSEMLNNAIEHSKSKTIDIEVIKRDGNLLFTVRDFGIGVFRNIMNKRKLKSELEAIQDLLKGKTSTAPKAHSGEGIFFTSKISDRFFLESYGYKLVIDNTIPDVFVENPEKKLKGTVVCFNISLKSKKHLNDVFRKYQTDPKTYAFDKTEVTIKLYTMVTIYISRSQARRVLSGLEKFKTIIMDFKEVPTIGQAFADEIFRVFKTDHPGITITSKNMNKAVAFMVGRVGEI